jgi:hypothetical protein
MIKAIYLTLEVNTSFDNSTPTMSFSTKSSTYKSGLPLATVNGFVGIREEKKHTHKKLQNKA